MRSQETNKIYKPSTKKLKEQGSNYKDELTKNKIEKTFQFEVIFTNKISKTWAESERKRSSKFVVFVFMGNAKTETYERNEGKKRKSNRYQTRYHHYTHTIHEGRE
jgi:hypothetical protein